jgi:hypothetical protein
MPPSIQRGDDGGGDYERDRTDTLGKQEMMARKMRSQGTTDGGCRAFERFVARM